ACLAPPGGERNKPEFHGPDGVSREKTRIRVGPRENDHRKIAPKFHNRKKAGRIFPWCGALGTHTPYDNECSANASSRVDRRIRLVDRHRGQESAQGARLFPASAVRA